VNLAKRLLSDLLATLKSLSDLRAAKYYVCGIFPVEGVGLSTFNNNEDLDHCVDLADAFGMTEEDVERALNAVGITGQQQSAAVAALRAGANGVLFFNGTQRLFNPQLVLAYITAVKARGCVEDVQVHDSNQSLTRNQVLAAASASTTDLLSRFLLASCQLGRTFNEVIATPRMNAASYLLHVESSR
jgi:hypothetical protein